MSDPSPWFAFVPNKQKTIWLKFSEAMDTGQGIRISEDTRFAAGTILW